MPRVPYDKPHLSLDEQVKLLEDRKMNIPDREQAKAILDQVGYYRLGFYWHFFVIDHKKHTFQQNTNFRDVVNLYNFDRSLRVLFLDAIDRIEIFARVQWVYHMSEIHGSHAHTIRDIHFHHANNSWLSNFGSMIYEIKKSKKESINKLMDKYSEPTPPIWAVAEILSFGSLSRWYKCLNDERVKWKISRSFNYSSYSAVESVLHHLSVVRNSCAHHERLWNWEFGRNQPQFPKRLMEYKVPSPRIYNTLLIIIDLLETIDSGSGWKQQLIGLIDGNSSVPQNSMGFPENWRDSPFWQ